MARLQHVCAKICVAVLVLLAGNTCEAAKNMPQDIDDFMNGAGEYGAILFSIHSMSAEMPERTRQIFVNVFSKLKQRVVWRWSVEKMHDTPSNVLLREWRPYQEINILGHPNIKLFLTHAEVPYVQEAGYHGIPVIGFPTTRDTDVYMKQVEFFGYGKSADIRNLDEDILEGVIMEVLNNASYRDKAKEMSVAMRNVAQNPLSKATFWVEYVMRHKGAPRFTSTEKSFLQYYHLDAIFLLLGVTHLIVEFAKIFCKAARKLKEWVDGMNMYYI